MRLHKAGRGHCPGIDQRRKRLVAVQFQRHDRVKGQARGAGSDFFLHGLRAEVFQRQSQCADLGNGLNGKAVLRITGRRHLPLGRHYGHGRKVAGDICQKGDVVGIGPAGSLAELRVRAVHHRLDFCNVRHGVFLLIKPQ